MVKQLQKEPRKTFSKRAQAADAVLQHLTAVGNIAQTVLHTDNAKHATVKNMADTQALAYPNHCAELDDHRDDDRQRLLHLDGQEERKRHRAQVHDRRDLRA